MKDFKIDLPVSNQFDKSHDQDWAHRICAVCSVWMLLKHHKPDFNRPVMDLVRDCIAKEGYVQNIGWKHSAIVDLAANHGLSLTYASKFFYTPKEKETGLGIIRRNLQANQPVIVSMFHHLNPAKSGHMVVVSGMQEFAGNPIGFHITDPDASFRGHQYFLTKQEFVDGWRGGLIWSK